jgi:hypothetical protein
MRIVAVFPRAKQQRADGAALDRDEHRQRRPPEEARRMTPEDWALRDGRRSDRASGRAGRGRPIGCLKDVA